jgi:hypothetical protein
LENIPKANVPENKDINTDLGRDADAEHLEAISKTSDYIKTLDQGASSTLVAALDPKLNGK